LLRSHKIRLEDLEYRYEYLYYHFDIRILEDFGDNQISLKVQEARYNYFYKKKRAKIEILRRILEQKRLNDLKNKDNEIQQQVPMQRQDTLQSSMR
jgi:hypothetical protein